MDKNKRAKQAISLFEIAIMTLSIISITYLISSSAEIVSAQLQPTYTCKENKQGAFCQEYLSSDCDANCKTPCFPGRRSDFSECRTGCCQDNAEGICTPNTAKALCESPGGIWTQDTNCNIESCARGCCILGRQTAFVTEKRCEQLSTNTGVRKDFRQNIRNEVECLLLAEEQTQGACLIPGPNNVFGCKFLTQQECLQQTHNPQSFRPNFLCSAVELNTNCQKQAKKACVEGEDKVYWFDSCGNRENIFSENRDTSWNNGRVLTQAQSCNPGQLNIGKQCGNCDYLLGSRCSEVSNEAQCISLECKDENNKKRRNGESWCAYDSKFDEGKDVVGSRHWRRSCIDGSVITEGCGDYRTGICVQKDSELGNSEKFSAASCRVNRWQECFNVNSQFQNRDLSDEAVKDEFKEECEKIPDCYIRNTIVDKGDKFAFTLCLPKYPPGFDLLDTTFSSAAATQCSQASTTCKMVFQKSILGKWKCKVNCDCMGNLAVEMNKVCTSLGDCGGKANILGDFEKNYRISGWNAKNLDRSDIDEYKNNAIPEKDKFIEAQSMNEILAALGLPANSFDPNSPDFNPAYADSIGMAAAGLYGTVAVYVASSIVTSTSYGTIAALKAAFTGKFIVAAGASQFSVVMAGVAQGLIILGIGLLAATLFTKIFGLQGDAALTVMVVGGVAGAVTGVFVGANAAGLSWGISFGPGALIVIAVVLVVTAILKLLGIGDTKDRAVSFTCKPWLPEHGGSKCHLCTENKLTQGFKKCSKYRCQSLGQTCQFLNEGTGKEECIDSNPNDVTSPVISPLVPSNIAFTKTPDSYELTQCIEPFNNLSLGVATNEPAQCRFDTAHTTSFEEMEFDIDSGILTKQHQTSFFLPSLEALQYATEAGISDIQRQTQDLRFFVRCQDSRGNTNINEYSIKTCVNPEPDKTAPRIQSLNPAQGKIAFNSAQMNVQLFTNEPAECKWSLSDKLYSDMENSLQCQNSLSDATILGFKCNGILSGLQNKASVFFRCKDQPWETDDAKRNTNVQSFVYGLTQSTQQLNITSLQPENGATIVNGIEPVSVTLTATTAGGIDNGKANCQYKLNAVPPVLFFNTGTTTHSQIFQFMFRGTHNLNVSCTDLAGNVAEKIISFNIALDTTPPLLTRVYRSAGSLRISTDENSECAFSTNTCNFNFVNGTKMSGLGIEHTASLDSDFTYHIKCRDIWNNEPNTCTARVKVYGK